MVDLGCGMGNYVRHFRKSGLSASGFDGNPATPQLSKGACSVLDLSVVADVPEPFDWVMSLEVGEHLPKAYEEAFMENLSFTASRDKTIAALGNLSALQFELTNTFTKSRVMLFLRCKTLL